MLGLHDELVGVRLLRRLDHLGVGRLEAAVADVFHQRAVEQLRILRDHRNVAAQAVLGDVEDILAVDPDRAGVALEQAQDQPG